MEQCFLEFIKCQRNLGYTKGNEILRLSKEELEIFMHLARYTLNCNFILDCISEDELKKLTKECLNNYFSLHNIKKTRDNYTLSTKGKIFGFQINKAWNKCLEEADPYSIPIKYYNAESNFGYLLMAYPRLKIDMDFKIENVGMVAIILGSELTALSIPSYAHELMHTQLEDKRIYTNDFYNKEVLSRFVEFLVSYNLSTNKEYSYLNRGFTSIYDMKKIVNMNFLKQDLNALINIKNGRDFSDKEYICLIEISTYINSTLVAMELFGNYINADSDSVRRKIIYGIQDVMNGKITIEELLEENKIGKTPGKRLEIVRKWVR